MVHRAIALVVALLATASIATGVAPAIGASSPHLPVPEIGAPSPSIHPSAGGVASWPTYMADPERTGANHQEHILAPSNVSELRPLWSVPSNGSDFSAPIVVNGTVYFGSWGGNEYAVGAANGTVLWHTYLGVDTICGGYSPMGISSTPAYAAGSIYLGGGDGYWYALNASTGATEWRFLPGSEADGYYAWASSLVHAGSLYIGTASCFDNPLVPAGLLEVSLATHAVTHSFAATPVGLVGESIWTTPALDPTNNSIWVTTGNENPPGYPRYANAVVGLNATTLNVSGSWQVPDVAGQDADFGSTPTLLWTGAGTPMVVASDKNGVAYALDRANVSVNGTWGPSWNLGTGGGFSGGAFDGTTLYLAGGSTVYAVDPANGSVLWAAPMYGGGDILGSLSWANGLVYAGGGDEVEAIDAANGSVLWNATLPGDESTVTEPVVVDGELFVASGDYGSNGAMTAYALPGGAPYTVSFSESGLPAGHLWTASVGGIVLTSTHPSVSFAEPNGSFAYLVHGPAGFRVLGIAPAGNVTVAGAPVNERVTFVRGATYSISMTEHGLPHHALWCVTIGWETCSTRGTIARAALTPGTYPYAVRPMAGQTISAKLRGVVIPLAGTLTLTTRGAPVSLHYVFPYAITFSEVGLPAGTVWSVRMHGTTLTSNGSSIAFVLGNGSYAFRIGPVAGYAASAHPTTVRVRGAPTSVAVTFRARGA